MAERKAIKMVLCYTYGTDMGDYNSAYYKNNSLDNIYISIKFYAKNKSHGFTVALNLY